MTNNSLKQNLTIGSENFIVHNINLLKETGLADISNLPFAARVLIENLARNMDSKIIQWSDIINAAKFYETCSVDSQLIAYYPARVLMQDFTGVPAVVDFAAMRNAVKKAGLDPKK